MNGARRFEIWLGFAGVGAIATLLLGVAGQMMARRIGLQELGGIWVGCLASFAGSLAGAVPLAQEGKELKNIKTIDKLKQRGK